jgi:hypothetical protein
MDVILLTALVLGAALTPVLCRKMVSATPLIAVVVTLIVSFYGFLPAILIRAGIIENSGLRSLLALAFFVGFSVISTVAVTGARSRAEHKREPQ